MGRLAQPGTKNTIKIKFKLTKTPVIYNAGSMKTALRFMGVGNKSHIKNAVYTDSVGKEHVLYYD